MNYKKIIKNRGTRQKILSLLSFIPDKPMVELQYLMKIRHRLNLKAPERYTEKLQWYKLYYRDPLMAQCVDKYEVRKYVEKKGLGNILNECYGIYDRVEDIDFDSLPAQFVMKKTNGSGGLNVIICKDKTQLDIVDTKKILNDWLMPYSADTGGREWAYYGLKNRIVIEKYLENEEDTEAGISDYKFFCFNGRVTHLAVDVDRFIGHKRNFYDGEWNYLDVSSDCPSFGDHISKPEGFSTLVATAETLAEDFPCVRTDLYLLAGKVIFGELTFYPWSGYVRFSPDSFDYELGAEFGLPEKRCK